jgi:hypothetical protein
MRPHFQQLKEPGNMQQGHMRKQAMLRLQSTADDFCILQLLCNDHLCKCAVYATHNETQPPMPVAACSYDQLREMTRGKTVVVLPAFETAPQKNMTLAHDLADTAAMMNKEQLGRLVQKRLIYQFALYLFRQVRRSRATASGWKAVEQRCSCAACMHARGAAGRPQQVAGAVWVQSFSANLYGCRVSLPPASN